MKPTGLNSRFQHAYGNRFENTLQATLTLLNPTWPTFNALLLRKMSTHYANFDWKAQQKTLDDIFFSDEDVIKRQEFYFNVLHSQN